MTVHFELLSLLRRIIQRLLMMEADASRCIASIILCLEIGLKYGLIVNDFLICFNFIFVFTLLIVWLGLLKIRCQSSDVKTLRY